MNETEVREMFETLTRNPLPSRYEPESVRSASRRQSRVRLVGVVAGSLIAIALGGLVIIDRGREDPHPQPAISNPTDPTFTDVGEIQLRRTSDKISDQDLALVAGFVRYAEAPSPDRAAKVPFAAQLQLGASTELRTIDSTVLDHPAGWLYPPATTSTPAGGYDLLAKFRRYLDSGQPSPPLDIGIGDKQWCTGSSEPRPTLDGLHRITIQPTRRAQVSLVNEDVECHDWFSISVYLDEQRNIAAVVSDVYNPDPNS